MKTNLVFLFVILFFFGFKTEAAKSLEYNTGRFVESPENDGSIDNTIVITYSNTIGDTLTGMAGEDFVAMGKVVVTNLPTGLSARILKTGNLTLIAVLTGNATEHNNANDIWNLQFTFQNSAFLSNYAAGVTNYNKSNIEVEFMQIINVGSTGDYTTIAGALAVCDDGDILNLAAETFTEHSLEVGYGWDPYVHAINDITIQGQGPGNTIVQGANAPNTDSGEIFMIWLGYNVTIKDLTVRYGKDDYGGGISCSSEQTNLINLDIYENTATHSMGGAIYVAEGYSVSIENSSIHDNTGHGLSVFGNVSVTNSTIAKNSRIGTKGGGIYCEAGTLNLLNCTIAENTGDGLWTYAGDISVLNTIMANNSVVDYSVQGYVTLSDNGFNVIEKQSAYQINGNWRFTNSNDILFNYMADGTSSTQWTKNNVVMANQNLDVAVMLSDNSYLNATPTLGVSPNSFVINAGTDTGAPTTDQRGMSRNGTTDIGAYERNAVNASIPTITTATITTFNMTSATLGGDVTSEGGATVTERGVVYALTGTPEMSDTKVQIGSGTGSFSQSVTGLLRGTTYFVRAYASNSAGTAFGSVLTFTTESGKPVIANLDGDTGTYTEGDADLALDSGGDAIVSNPYSNFNGGKLTVSGANYVTEFKTISPSVNLVLSNGMNSGSTIAIGGVVVGSIATGKTGRNGAELVVAFNPNATDEHVGTLLHHIKYYNTSETSLGTRQIWFTLQNAQAVVSDAATVTITAYAANDAPILTATALNPTFIEGNSIVTLFSNAIASTVESGQLFTDITLTISNVTDGSFEYLSLDGSLISLTNSTTGTSIENSLPYSVSVIETTTTVNITGVSLSVAEVQTLINTLGYSNSSDNPIETNRVVTITRLSDNGGTENGGDDTAELAVASSVSVVSGNPVITNLDGNTGTFKEGDNPLLVDSESDATVINNSSSGFSGGNLTVAIVSASVTESLSIETSASIVLSNGMVAGSTISISGTIIGTIATGSDGQAGNNLIVSLNSNTTTALLGFLIHNITYSNNTEIELGSRSVQFTLQNAIAFTSAVSTVTITALALNDPPTLTINSVYPTFIEHGSPVQVYSGASASTVEGGQLFTGFAFVVSNLPDGASEQVVVDGTFISINNGNTGTTLTNSLMYTVSVGGSVAIVTVSGGSMSAAQLELVLDNLSYFNSSSTPSTSPNRLFRINSLTDNGGSANGGSATASLFISSTVYVVATLEPTVSTNAITVSDAYSATLGGNVTADGGTSVTERGVVYSFVDNTPTIGEADVTKNANGTTGTGTFSKSITGLSPGNTYYVRAYAINAEGTAYGAVQSFSTSTIPTLLTTAISTFDGTSATMGGNIADDGGVAVTERGVVYSSTDNTPAIDEPDVTKADHGSTGIGTFSASLGGLLRGTTYFVRAYATNSAGTAYGSTETFTTKDYPVVSTSVAGSVKIHSVVLGGHVTSDGGLPVTGRGVVFSTTDDTPTIAEGADNHNIGIGTGVFVENFSGLIFGTTYFYNTYAVNAEGIIYGTASSFSTASTSTFSGTANWNSDANWSAGVPITGGTAIIEGNPTLSASNITVDNMTIHSGTVHVNQGIKLTVLHSLNVNQNSGGIVVDGE